MSIVFLIEVLLKSVKLFSNFLKFCDFSGGGSETHKGGLVRGSPRGGSADAEVFKKFVKNL